MIETYWGKSELCNRAIVKQLLCTTEENVLLLLEHYFLNYFPWNTELRDGMFWWKKISFCEQIRFGNPAWPRANYHMKCFGEFCIKEVILLQHCSKLFEYREGPLQNAYIICENQRSILWETWQERICIVSQKSFPPAMAWGVRKVNALKHRA